MTAPKNDNKTKERRLFPRYPVSIKAKVKVRLFGSAHSINCTTVNVSKNGMLLAAEDSIEHLNKSSLLEIWLFLSSAMRDDDAIYCVAKFVRKEEPNKLGVKISEMHSDDKLRYVEFINKYALAEEQEH